MIILTILYDNFVLSESYRLICYRESSSVEPTVSLLLCYLTFILSGSQTETKFSFTDELWISEMIENTHINVVQSAINLPSPGRLHLGVKS